MKYYFLLVVMAVGATNSMEKNQKNDQHIKLKITKTVAEVIVSNKQYVKRTITPPIPVQQKKDGEENSSIIALSPPFYFNVYSNSPDDLRSSLH